jgi:hypothetical protein
MIQNHVICISYLILSDAGDLRPVAWYKDFKSQESKEKGGQWSLNSDPPRHLLSRIRHEYFLYYYKIKKMKEHKTKFLIKKHLIKWNM